MRAGAGQHSAVQARGGAGARAGAAEPAFAGRRGRPAGTNTAHPGLQQGLYLTSAP